MRKTLFSTAALAAFLALTTVSCSKKGGNDPAPAPAQTGLRITFTQGNTPSSNVAVSLYASETGWLTESGAVKTGTTDAQGQVTFTGLSSQRYWWMGKSGCVNNNNSITSTASAIPSGQTSNIATQLQSTGTLKMVNTSTNPYRVWVDGELFGDQQGGSTVSYSYQPTGTHTIRVLQLSGYVATPTDRTFQGTLNCGATLTTTYP